MNGVPARVLAKLLRTAGALSVVTIANAGGEAAEPAGNAPAPTTAAARTQAEQSAIDRARRALDQRRQWVEGLTVESVTPSQWPNSGLGCPRPGVSYRQVITSGYTVTFAGEKARREVHVAGDSAVVCGDTLAIKPKFVERGLKMPQKKPSSPPPRE